MSASGISSFSVSTSSLLPVGLYNITASYGGDENYFSCTAAPIPQTVIRFTSSDAESVSSSSPLSVVPSPHISYGESIRFALNLTVDNTGDEVDPLGVGGFISYTLTASSIHLSSPLTITGTLSLTTFTSLSPSLYTTEIEFMTLPGTNQAFPIGHYYFSANYSGDDSDESLTAPFVTSNILSTTSIVAASPVIAIHPVSSVGSSSFRWLLSMVNLYRC